MMKKQVLSQVFMMSLLLLGVSIMSFVSDEKKVYVENTTFDFGTITADGGNVEGTFVLRNNTESTVSITNVKAACGCTVPSWDKSPIEPGKTREIKVSFNPRGKSGSVNKSVTVTMDSGETFRMYIKGIIAKREALNR